MAKAKSKAKAGVKRFRQAMETRPGKIVRFGLEATGGAVVTSLAVNKMPVIREQSQGIKSGAQGATGLAMVFLGPKRWPIVKRAGAGAIIAAIMGGVKAVLKVDPLAGPPSPGGRTLSNEAMRRITGGRVGMGRPANVTMGRPANVTMNGSGSGGWNPGWG